MKEVFGDHEQEIKTREQFEEEQNKLSAFKREKNEELKNIIKEAIRDGHLTRDDLGRFNLFGKKRDEKKIKTD